MDVKMVLAPVTRFGGKLLLKARRYAPEAMLIGGTVSVIYATVEACKAAPKASEVLDEFNKKKEECKRALEDPELEDIRKEKGYDIAAYRKEMFGIYSDTCVKLLKVYWKPIVTGLAGFGLIFGAHGLLRRHVTRLTAACTVLESTFNKYRNRVVDKYGEEVDKEFMTGVKKVRDAAVKTIDPETGEEKIEKADIEKVDLDDVSDYSRLFAPGTTTQWDNNPAYNLAFLKGQQTVFNTILHTRGHVFLNEVYDALGFKHTPAGAVVGWRDNGTGDGFIDFGIVEDLYSETDKYNAKKRVHASLEGYLLNFNVDGVIWDKI